MLRQFSMTLNADLFQHKPQVFSKQKYSQITYIPVDGEMLIQCHVSVIQLLCNKLHTLNTSRARGYKTFFMLNSVEHEIFPAHIC